MLTSMLLQLIIGLVEFDYCDMKKKIHFLLMFILRCLQTIMRNNAELRRTIFFQKANLREGILTSIL